MQEQLPKMDQDISECPVCGRNIALVGRVHNCNPVNRPVNVHVHRVIAGASDHAVTKPVPATVTGTKDNVTGTSKPWSGLVTGTDWSKCPVCARRRESDTKKKARLRAKRVTSTLHHDGNA